MKFFGAFMVVGAAVFIGLIKCRQLKMQEKLVAEVIYALELIKNEIGTRRTPLKSVFKIMTKATRVPDMTAFADEIVNSMDRLGEKSFGDIWSESVKRNLILLPDDIKNVLFELGMNLGRYDAEKQEAVIERCLLLAVKEHEKLRSMLKTNEKMYMGLYSGVGAIIAIVFI